MPLIRFRMFSQTPEPPGTSQRQMPKTGAFPAELIFNLHTQKALGYLVIKEAIQHSQRVEAFCVYATKRREVGFWFYEGTVIGYQKIVKLSEAFTRKLKIVFSDYRVAPLISFVGIYPKR